VRVLNSTGDAVDHHQPRSVARVRRLGGNAPFVKRKVQQFG
jgi:hypothetical protein